MCLRDSSHQKGHAGICSITSSEDESEKTMPFPPGFLGYLPLEPWAAIQEVQLPWGFCAVRKSGHMERPWVDASTNSPRWNYQLTASNNLRVSKDASMGFWSPAIELLLAVESLQLRPQTLDILEQRKTKLLVSFVNFHHFINGKFWGDLINSYYNWIYYN